MTTGASAGPTAGRLLALRRRRELICAWRRRHRFMENFLQQLINGVTLGAIYGLIAIGYTMVFGIIGMVNFAHGDVFMLSAFIALIIFLAPLISAIGMSIFLANFVQVTQGPRTKPVPPMFTDVIHLTPGGAFDVTLSYKQVLIVVVTGVLLFAFWYLVQKTALGRAQRA